jgi:anti-sigma B factor antagonist
MTVHIEMDATAPGVRTVRLTGELDLSGYDLVSEALKRLEREQPPPAKVVVDLRELTFMDSTGARVLAEAHRRAQRAGHRLAVVRGNGQPSRVIEMLRLDGHLEMMPDPPSAAPLASQEGPPGAAA